MRTSESQARVRSHGIDGNMASSGSCTIVTPPASLMANRPAVPSSRFPLSTTPTAAVPKASAAERNRGSAADGTRAQT